MVQTILEFQRTYWTTCSSYPIIPSLICIVHSFACLFTLKLVGKWIIRCFDISLFWTIVLGGTEYNHEQREIRRGISAWRMRNESLDNLLTGIKGRWRGSDRGEWNGGGSWKRKGQKRWMGEKQIRCFRNNGFHLKKLVELEARRHC